MAVYQLKGDKLFPVLSNFMGSWFHQDFDIEGDTLEEIVAAFKSDSEQQLIDRLVADIEAFLETGDEGMEERFQEYFEPCIIPTGFRPSTREFLISIRDELVSKAA